MTRFFVSPEDVGKKTIRLSTEDITHIRSLRLKPCELFTVCAGDGIDYICKLGEKGAAPVAEITEKHPSRSEPGVKCTVYIAYTKGDRMDYAVHKSVELGVYEIILYPSARCVAIPNNIQKKVTRLQRISLEASKMSGRGRVPQILTADSFNDAISRAKTADIPLFFYELENTLSLKTALEKQTAEQSITGLHGQKESIPSISVFIGPEGGFEPVEAEKAEKAGMITASLGTRILRNDTAPAAALTAIMYHFGEI